MKNRSCTFLASASVVVFLIGCAGANYRPIVDNKGVDLNRYEADLSECQSYATQTAGAAQSAAAGAAVGAILGAAVAAAAGSSYDRDASARVGALSGAVGAGAGGERNQKNIINRCLTGRGYRVLQ
jgi:outer membrane lipoprotein SlyB